MSLARLIRERFIVSLVCYADESGTHDVLGLQPGSDVAGVVGWLSRDDDWDRFTLLWRRTLKAFGVDEFHYADFNSLERRRDDPTWAYYGWSDKKRQKYIDELIPIARDNTLLGIGGLVSVKDYDRLTPDWLKAITKHPYHFCFQFFFNCLLRDVETRISPPLDGGEKIAFVFERQMEFKVRALEQFEEIKLHTDRNGRLGTITNDADRAEYIPLQAADLLAGRMRIVTSRGVAGREPIVSAGSWDEALDARHTLSVRYFEGETLKQAIDSTIDLHIEEYRKMGYL